MTARVFFTRFRTFPNAFTQNFYLKRGTKLEAAQKWQRQLQTQQSTTVRGVKVKNAFPSAKTRKIISLLASLAAMEGRVGTASKQRSERSHRWCASGWECFQI